MPTAANKDNSRNKIIAIILLTLTFWSFIPFSPYHHYFIIIAIAIIIEGIIRHKKKNAAFPMEYKNIIMGFIILRLLSSIPCYLFHNQGIIYTIIIERTSFLWLFYFYLHYNHISPKVLIKIMIWVAIIWGAITILQQFTYPTYFFTSREDSTGDIQYRAGIYRFMIEGFQYAVIAGLIGFSFFLIYKKKASLYLYTFIFIAIYYFSARQYIVAFFISSVSIIFYIKNSSKRKIAFGIISIFIIILILNFDTVFSGYINQSKEDMNENNIRLTAIHYFGNTYFPHWLCNILGNGMPYSQSSYGNEYFITLNKNMMLYRSDVGIIGTYNQYGIIYSLLVIYSYIKALSLRYLQKRIFLKTTAIFFLALICLSEHSYRVSAIPFFSIYFYLIDYYSYEYKKATYSRTYIHKRAK